MSHEGCNHNNNNNKKLHTTLPRVGLHYLSVFTVTFDENGMVLKLNRLINLA